MDTAQSLVLGGLALGLLLLGCLALALAISRQGAEPESWQFRCLTCGSSKALEELGGSRTAAWSPFSRTLLRCTHCQGLRWAALERCDSETEA